MDSVEKKMYGLGGKEKILRLERTSIQSSGERGKFTLTSVTLY